MPRASTISHLTFQCSAKASASGHRRLDEVATLCRRLYNAALQERRDTYRHQRANPHLDLPQVNLYHQYAELTAIRKDDERYRALDTAVTRGALLRLDRAMKAFFRRVKRGETPGFPRFQGRNRYRCIELSQVRESWFRFSDDRTRGRLKIKGLPTIRFRSSRPLPDGKPVTLRINLTPTGIRVDLVFEHDPERLPPTGKIVGVDAGVEQRLTLSDGSHVEGRKRDRRRERRLGRAVARSKRGSKTRRKRVQALAREKRRDKVRNRNECHRVTTDLVQRYDLIAVEALKITNMVRSAKGTIESPGKNVAAKSGLNRSIADQTWGLLRTQLAYKAAWAGREYVEVDPRYTSQTCSACGVIDAESRRSQAVFRCAACGSGQNADVNAARNILRRALPAEGRDFALGAST